MTLEEKIEELNAPFTHKESNKIDGKALGRRQDKSL